MKRRKIVVCLMMSGLIACSTVPGVSPVFAMGAPSDAVPAITVTNASVITPRAEETEWRYRFVDGKMQKRLWSVTYLKWLTDWEWI